MGRQIFITVVCLIGFNAYAANSFDPLEPRINREKPVSPRMMNPVDESGSFIPVSYEADRQTRFQQAVAEQDPIKILDEGTPDEIARELGLSTEDEATGDPAQDLLQEAVWVAGGGVRINVSIANQSLSISSPSGSYGGIPVSTARKGYHTATGCYHPKRLESVWYSQKYDNAPMPHAIFYDGGYAIHGTYEQAHLGRPASHGCIRVSLRNAAAIFGIVQTYGPQNTTICVE